MKALKTLPRLGGGQPGRRAAGVSWRLSTRLWLAFGLVLGLLLLTTALALFRMHRMDALSTSVVEEHNARIAAAQAMMNGANEITVAMVGVALVYDDLDGQEQAKQLTEAVKRYNQAREQYGALLGDAAKDHEGLKAVDEIAQLGTFRIEDMTIQLTTGASNVANTVRARDPRAVQQDWLNGIANLVKLETEAGHSKHAQAKKEFTTAWVVMIVFAGVAIAFAVVSVTVLLRSVTGPLMQAIEHAKRISAGDLTGHIASDRRDETGDLLNALAGMQDQLRGLVGEIRSSAEGIAQASREIAQGNLDLSNRTEQAASDLQSTSSSVVELAGIVRESAASATQADALAGAAETAAREGGAAVAKVVDSMTEIQSGARKIAEITAVIDSIAFQTNILSLNAAVEAAQAGESGRGFAIVAAEVRNLAQRSAAAGRDIKNLVEQSMRSVDAGTRMAREAGDAMGNIVESVQRTAETIGAVSAAAVRQSSGIEQVNESVARLDEMTQRNAALVEESTAAAQGLQQQSAHLEELVGTFRVA